jgi:hypothetical protein
MHPHIKILSFETLKHCCTSPCCRQGESKSIGFIQCAIANA